MCIEARLRFEDGLFLFFIGQGSEMENNCTFFDVSKQALLLFALGYILMVSPSPSFAGACDESPCIINVVWERFYASWGVANLHYAYVPTAQWSTDDCPTAPYAKDAGRPYPHPFVEPAYLVGWVKAYYDGHSWTLLGGDSGKYFLTQITPFHADADVILAGPLPGSNPVAEALNASYPNGCSDLPTQQLSSTADSDTGKQCPMVAAE